MRNKGTFNFSGNLEVKKDAPLEAGSIVPTYADLTKAETWTDEEGSVWVYKGKNVTCEDRPGKLYQLTSTDYTKTSNWVEIGGGGTGGGIAEAPEDGKLYGRQNAAWSEINDYIIIPESAMSLENTSTSDEILDTFGGLDQFIELTNEIASNNKPLILASNYDGTSQSIVFIFAMCSTNSSSLNRTLTLQYQIGIDLTGVEIRYENGQASFTRIEKEVQIDPEVYYFSPTIQSNKVTQDDYTKLQQAITDGKIITVPVGIADLTTTGSRIPVAAYTIDNEISLNFVIDQDSAYPLWVYIRIDGSTKNITVTKRVMGQTSKAISGLVSVSGNTELSGTQAMGFVNSMFGSFNDYKNVVMDIIQNHSQYHITLPEDTLDTYFQLSNVVAYHDSSSADMYLLMFTISLPAENYAVDVHSFYINVDGTGGWVKVNSLIKSNNLTTATKISATDYAALDPKDANTMYAVTE